MGQLSGVSTLLLIVFCLFVMQAIGGYFQIKDYRKSVKRVHKLGNVGIGQKRGQLLSGYLILIACNNNGIITGAEIMEGLSFFAKFKPTNTFLGKQLVGASIYDFLEITRNFDKKQNKKYRGYINALEALNIRLEENKEQEKTEEIAQES